MYYYGHFRNTDTKIDPLGQEYKVVIFTNYNGTDNPYGFDINGEPITGERLIMTTQPFLVSYENEDGNIYKPYKCSTATISFLVSNLNFDLFTNKYNNILVALLKRNNDVILSGDSYINRNTNEVLIRKRSYGLYYGFLPSEIDTYCYNVEWIGYATPNTYNQNYTLVKQEFQLECQDAFSTLKYESLPFNELIEIRDLITVLRFIIGGLGTYKHIYVQNNLILPDDGTVYLSKIVQQYRNFIEDEPVEKMKLIESIGTFLNISFIPFKDSVYIVQYEGVANNDNYFYHYTFDNNNNLFFNYRSDNPTWDHIIENKENNLTLTKDCYAGSDTNISMQTVYNNFSVSCDENEIDLIPKLTDDKYYTGLQSSIIMVDLYREGLTNRISWYGGVITNLQQVNGIGFKNYIYYQSYLRDSDNLPQDHYTPVSPTLTPRIFQMNSSDSYSTDKYCGCVLIKNASLRSTSARDYSRQYRFNYDNSLVFWNKNRFNNWEQVSHTTADEVWRDNHQVVLEYQSPRFFLVENKSLCFKGEWEFYRQTGFIPLVEEDNFYVDSSNDYHPLEIDKSKLYIKARVILTLEDGVNTYVFYLSNTDYRFAAGSEIVNLPLDYSNADMNKPFGQSFKFSGDDGFIVDFLQLDGTSLFSTYPNYIASLKIEIMNPVIAGIKTYEEPTYRVLFNRSARVKDLKFEIVDRYQSENWRFSNIKTNFKTEQNRFLETFEVENDLSTNEYVGKINYNYCIRVYNQHYYSLNNLNNISTGLVARPEILKLADIYNQYKDKTIGLNTTIWENLGITPNSRIKWENRFFIVDRQEIDYEANTNTLSLIEKKLSSELPELDMKMYCENDNGETIYINPLYRETYDLILITTNVYYRDGSAVMGYNTDDDYSPTLITNDINTLITFSTKFTDGIEAFVSIPNGLSYISVYINNSGELIINQ